MVEQEEDMSFKDLEGSFRSDHWLAPAPFYVV